MNDDLIARLRQGVRNIGLHSDNNTELFDIEDANDAMYDAANRIAELKALLSIERDHRANTAIF